MGVWQLVVALVAGYRGEMLALRAGNLTFITITSLVPLVALILSLVHALNETRLEQLVLRFLGDLLAPAGKHDLIDSVRQFLRLTRSATAGSLSFFFLLISAGLLLRHLDASLNAVWAVRRKRPLLVSVALYAGLLLVGPIAMAVGLVGTDGLKRLMMRADAGASVLIALGAVASATALFTLLYKLAPHAPVAWRSAVTGGLVAGVAWELARHLYAGIARLFFSANPLYGSLGVAPLFLMWIYVGWYILLSGARMAYAVEHAGYHAEFRDLLEHPRSTELIATRIAALAARAALRQEPAPSTKQLANSLQLPQQRVADVVHQLVTAKLLTVDQDAVRPAREPSLLTLADISAAVGGSAMLGPRESRRGFETVARLFLEADETSIEKLRRISWFDVAETSEEVPRKT